MNLTETEIKAKIVALEKRHRKLDAEIQRLIDEETGTEFTIKRLKRKKLKAKDLLILYQNMLIPDINA